MIDQISKTNPLLGILTRKIKSTHQVEIASVAVGHLMAIDAIRLSITVANASGATDYLSKSFQQDIGHHPVLILDLVLCELHDHEGLGGNLVRE